MGKLESVRVRVVHNFTADIKENPYQLSTEKRGATLPGIAFSPL